MDGPLKKHLKCVNRMQSYCNYIISLERYIQVEDNELFNILIAKSIF